MMTAMNVSVEQQHNVSTQHKVIFAIGIGYTYMEYSINAQSKL